MAILTVIDGVDVESELEEDDSPTDAGYFYYDPESNTLKIKGGIAVSENDYALYNNIKDLTIETDKDGSALFQSMNGRAAMYVEKRTYITGGLLTVAGGTLLNPTTCGLIAKHIVRVEDGSLFVVGTYGISGAYDNSGGSITYYGGMAIKGISGVAAYGSEA